MLLDLALNFVGFNAVEMLIYSAVLNGLLAQPLILPDGMFAVTSAGGAEFIQDGGFFMMGRSWGPDPSWGDPTHSALQILNERFARGEIQINPSR